MLLKLLFIAICFHNNIQSNGKEFLGQLGPRSINSLIKGLHSSNNHEKSDDKLNDLITSRSFHPTQEVSEVVFEIENKTFSLNLIPVHHNVYSVNTFVWTVKSDVDVKTGHVFKKETVILTKQFYQDFKNKAIVYKNDDKYDGVFGEGRKKKAIHSIPGRSRYSRNSDDQIILHNRKKITTIESLITDDDFVRFQKVEKPLEILYPKLLLVIEWNYFKMLGQSTFDAIKYLFIFWNAVNLKYQEISTPKVNITISGVVIVTDDAAIDFILKSRNKENPKKFDELKLLSLGNEYFGRTFKKEVNFTDYDSAVLMTNFTAGSTHGITIRGQICNKNLIYVSDDANYGGIAKATHELGHSLGLSHDGRKTSRWSSSKSIMEPYITSPEEYYWSDQSLDQIQAFSMTRQASCLSTPGRRK